jgi:hypothetical protein
MKFHFANLGVTNLVRVTLWCSSFRVRNELTLPHLHRCQRDEGS